MSNHLTPTPVPILHRSRSFRLRSGLPPSPPPPIERSSSSRTQASEARSQHGQARGGSQRSVFSMSDDDELADDLLLISLASSLTDVRVSATPRIDVKELPLVGELEMARREQERLEDVVLPRPFQVIKARVFAALPEFDRPVWKVYEQPQERLRAGDSIYVRLQESDGFVLNYAEPFTVLGEPVGLEHSMQVQLMSSAGIHVPVTLLLRAEWFAEEQIPEAVECALRKFWKKLWCGGGDLLD